MFEAKYAPLSHGSKAWRVEDQEINSITSRADTPSELNRLGAQQPMTTVGFNTVEDEVAVAPVQRSSRQVHTRRRIGAAHSRCHAERTGVTEQVQNMLSSRHLHYPLAILALIYIKPG